MTLFRESPFSLQFKDLIVARAKATNAIGDGPFSEINTTGVRVQTEPDAPLTAPTVQSYNEQSVELSIQLLTGDSLGGSPILYYDIEWDSGSQGALWSSYTTLSASTDIALITGLSSGTTYQFMYRAQNIFGWSLFSPSVEVLTMTEPHATDLPVTQVADANVKISWDQPYSGG